MEDYRICVKIEGMKKSDILIIGAGLSGLTAAKLLKSSGKSITILEESDRIGGRVKTDYIQGCQLDRGFQVLLTAYPEARKVLNYRTLDLHYFDPGAVILNENGITAISDPLRNPLQIWQTLTSSAGSFRDKMLILKLRQRLKHKQIDQIFNRQPLSTLQYLHDFGFSETMIANFFKPFFGGVFLEDELSTSAEVFEFLFKMFGEGRAAIPALGMGTIAEQLGESLDADDVVLNEKVIRYEDGRVFTNKDRCYEAEFVLLAAGENAVPGSETCAKGRAVTNIYFIAHRKPVLSKMLLLNASPKKLVNNIAVMDNISPFYAPLGKSLISVSLLGDHQLTLPNILVEQVKTELSKWFGETDNWTHLRTYHIPYALPDKSFYRDDIDLNKVRVSDRVFRCGDYLLNGSINAAIKSGRMAAEIISTF